MSELGARNAAHPWIVDAGIAVFGLSFVALGIALRPALPRRRAATAAMVLFAAAGAVIVLEGLLPMDCSITADTHCRALSDAGALSWHHYGHLWASLLSQLLLAATPFAIAAALWPAPSGAAGLGAGVSGLIAGVLVAVLDSPAHGGAGLGQRAGLAVLHLWVLIVAVGILSTTRGRPRVGPLIPLRPREFLARRWTGEGRLEVWPWFLGRRLAGSAPVTREAVWLSDRIWRFDDALHYADGRVQRRQTYCEFVASDHVRLTAADLPDGADVWFEEGGYRFSEFRMAFPVGPIAVRIHVRDVSHVDQDGTFVNVIVARAPIVGLPLARGLPRAAAGSRHRRRRRAGVGRGPGMRLALALVLLAVFAPAATAAPQTFRIGPIHLAPYGVDERDYVYGVPGPPVDGYLTGGSARIVDAAGRPVSAARVMMHHLAFSNAGERLGERTNPTCDRVTLFDSLSQVPGLSEPVAGFAEEHVDEHLPPGDGYPIRSSDRWIGTWMLMNHRDRPDTVFIEYTADVVTGEALKPAYPLWLDVGGCSLDPVFDVPVAGGAGGTGLRTRSRRRRPRRSPGASSRRSGTCTAAARATSSPSRRAATASWRARCRRGAARDR